MPPGTEPDKPRKPPWAEAVAVRRDRLAAGRVAHETKDFLKVLEAMAEKGYGVSVVPKSPGNAFYFVDSTDPDLVGDPFVGLGDVTDRANDLKAVAERLLVELQAFDEEKDLFPSYITQLREKSRK
jgi:hypothetical protein